MDLSPGTDAVGVLGADSVAAVDAGRVSGLEAIAGRHLGLTYVACGLTAWLRPPAIRLGAIRTGCGFAWECVGTVLVTELPCAF